jgi:hypothetical protein
LWLQQRLLLLQRRYDRVHTGTPLVFSAQLDISLDVYGNECQAPGVDCASSSASATVREGDSNPSSASIATPVSCGPGFCSGQPKSQRTSLQVVVTRAAGDPFTLHFDLTTSGHGSGDGSGQLHFSGLPPGASVVSCQGYQRDFPTAEKKTSWGRLKTIDR